MLSSLILDCSFQWCKPFYLTLINTWVTAFSDHDRLTDHFSLVHKVTYNESSILHFLIHRMRLSYPTQWRPCPSVRPSLITRSASVDLDDTLLVDEDSKGVPGSTRHFSDLGLRPLHLICPHSYILAYLRDWSWGRWPSLHVSTMRLVLPFSKALPHQKCCAAAYPQ